MARPADPHAREALILAARRAFVKHGLQGARIEDITAACKLSKGSFYLHFESKEALFGALVAALDAAIQRLTTERHAEYAVFRKQFGLGNVRSRTARVDPSALAALGAIDARYDRASLEVLWTYRDVVDVLMRGCRGTTFDGFIWSYLDTEVKRITEEIERMREYGLCRPDVPAEVAGSMLIGTFIMLARQMADAEVPPDFDYWVNALRVLLGEGLIPRAAPPAATAADRRHPRRSTR